MTRNRALKRRIRLRMRATGEGYLQARRALCPPELRPDSDRSSTAVKVDPQPTTSVPAAPAWTPRAQVLLRTAESWAIRLRHQHVGTEHVLLALVDDPAGIGAQVLEQFGPAERVRAEVLTILSSRGYYTGSVLDTDEHGRVVIDEATGLPRQHPVDPTAPTS